MQQLLTRYWFKTGPDTGLGVTGYSRGDAEQLLKKAGYASTDLRRVVEVVENIDVTTLDEGHIRPNMGPPSFRGVWYPCHNL